MGGRNKIKELRTQRFHMNSSVFLDGFTIEFERSSAIDAGLRHESVKLVGRIWFKGLVFICRGRWGGRTGSRFLAARGPVRRSGGMI